MFSYNQQNNQSAPPQGMHDRAKVELYFCCRS